LIVNAVFFDIIILNIFSTILTVNQKPMTMSVSASQLPIIVVTTTAVAAIVAAATIDM
jgi:hypothetical protein